MTIGWLRLAVIIVVVVVLVMIMIKSVVVLSLIESIHSPSIDNVMYRIFHAYDILSNNFISL